MEHRAYSVLTVKAVDDDQRIITGIATTPAPDRVGDIVEPLGVKFTNPLPLLHQHVASQPVGTVRFSKPTKDGITFEARLPKLDEPPTLKDRVDTAWGEVKAGLVRGVSIGFRSLEHSFMDDGGIRFIETEVLELSLVTIPANQDATIHTIKSIDVELLAASGKKQIGVSTPPRAGGTAQPVVRLHGAKGMPKPISDQILDFTNTRAEKAARMLDIMEKSGETGETLDEAQQQEYDGLDTELKAIDEHLDRLRKAEKLAAATARMVDGNTADGGTASRGAGGPVVTSMRRNLPPGIEFARYAMCLMSAKGNIDHALKIAEHRYPDEQRIQNVLKAAVAAGTTTDPTWAGPLTQYVDFAGDFIDFLRPMTIVGKFGTGNVPSLRAIPFNVRVKRQTSGGEAYWVGEGQAKPLTSFDFDTVTLRWAKIANIAVLTDEQVRFSSPSAEAAVRDALAGAIAARTDITFIDPTVTAIADTRPASITNGIAAVTASGTDAAAVRADVGTLMTNLANNNLPYGQAVWITNSAVSIPLMLMRNALDQPEFPTVMADGGTLFGRPLIVSDHIASPGSPAGGLLILMIPQEIYLSDDGQVMVDASREASLQMDDSPTMAATSGSPATPTGTSVVSMFQTNSVAIRAERYINWARRRDAAVQYVDGVNYAA